MQCIVITPEQTVHDGPADFVALPLYDGEIGIAPGHTPLVGRLGNGEVRINLPDQTARYYVEGGLVQVVGDVVSVLTEVAVPAATIDEAEAREQLARSAARRATTPEQLAARDRAMSRAWAKLRVVRRSRSE